MTRGPVEPDCRRWLVVGSGGAGKSTLARALGERLGLPVIHLDREFWRPGWVETPEAEWRARVQTLVQGDAWVMDGNYGGTVELRLPRAQAVVFLDLPAWRCLARVVRRRLTSLFRPRPDLPEGVKDRLDLDFLHWVVTFRWRGRRRLLRKLESDPGVPVYRLRRPSDVRAFLASLPTDG